MNNDRQKILTDYISYLFATGRTYDTVGKYIKHVRLMYERLEEGGTLAAITSQHWKFASEKKCIDFRNWLKEVHGEVFEISAGEFKESGTSISTMAVVIKNNSK